MKMADIVAKAKKLGLKASQNSNKSELIRSIQTSEGNIPCFDSGKNDCTQLDCCWRGDCIK